MFMLTRHKMFLFVCLLSASLAQAQNLTLADLVKQAKAKQQQNLLAKSATPTDDSVKFKNTAVSDAPDNNDEPALWSITGLNDQYVAEVIYKGAVHILRLTDGDRVVGPWVIERFGKKGLYLVHAQQPMGGNVKVGLFLPAPAVGSSLERDAAALLPSPPAFMPDARPRTYRASSGAADSVEKVMPQEVFQAADKSSNNLSIAVTPSGKQP
jgi:hypothetical protein